ncbi:MAG: aldehyde dehydrogenase family protein [Armatimonadetes bacterium]|nr:aldehyde dehydrogenase family protein [Armatimonadota bacterium]
MSTGVVVRLEPKTYYNYIGGQWVEAVSGERYATTNPADTSQTIGSFQRSNRDDIRRAIQAAADAQPAWRRTPAPRRAEILFRTWDLLRARADEYASYITLETGKVFADAKGEVKRGTNVLEFAAGDGRRLKGETVPSELPKNFIYTVRRPVGVAGLITPWNFPLAIPLWKLAPALVCGNTVVMKPATNTPLCAIKLAELFAEAGLPGSVFNVVSGPGGVVGDELVNSPDVRAISFTGSTDVGRRLYAQAAQSLKRVQCEMGGKNAVVVLEDAPLDLAVEAILQGAYGFCGQRCTATSRVIVDRKVKKALVDRLLERVKAMRVGDPFASDTQMGPLASESQIEKVTEYIEIGKSEGAKLQVGGVRPSGAPYEKGYYITPAVFTDVRPEMRLAQDEIFGPVLAVMECDGMEDAIRMVDTSTYGFKASVYTGDFFKIMHFIDEVDVGMVHVNAPTLGGEVQAPFGGIKGSGVGIKEQGRAQVEFFTEEIVVYMDYTGAKRDARFI